MQLQNAIARFLDEQSGLLSPSTISWYRTRFDWLTPLLQWPLTKITTDDLRAIWQSLIVRMSPTTSYMIVVAWRRLFNWCAQRGLLRSSPAAQLRKPPLPDQPPKALTRADLIRMLNASRCNPRDHAIICFLADTGCRVGGLAGLRIGDLELDRGRAVVHEKGLGGQRKSRTVHMVRRTSNALRAWLDVRELPGRSVFGLKPSGVYQVLERTARRGGVRGRWNPHSFRHGFARGLLDNGADLATVSALMGHSDVSITVRFYARWSDEELHRKHARFSWLPDI